MKNRILVVDDNDAILKMLTTVLEMEDYEVAQAQDSDAALAILDGFRPDVILLDVMMPGTDGFATCRKIRASFEHRTVYIIFVTARATTADKITGLDGGGDDYVTKPFDHEELLARIRRGITIGAGRRAATRDGLTGLFNRGFLDESLVRLVSEAERYGHALSLAMLDIDHFKRVNDTHGHAAGDDVLRRVGAILQSEARTSDLPTRYGGEEMMVVLTMTSLSAAAEVAERMRARIAATDFPVVGHVTVSIGVAQMQGGEGGLSLIQRADAALYQAKHGGRNLVCTSDNR